MLKLIATGLWVCIVTLAAVWFSISQATKPPDSADAAKAKVDTEVVKVETISIPVISKGGVKGYFLSRVTLIVDKVKFKAAKLPADTFLTDELFTLLVGHKMVDLTEIQQFDLSGFKDLIKKGMNERYEGEIVMDVLVEQLDYLSKADVRANLDAQNHDRKGTKIIEGEEAPEAPPPSGH